MEVAGDWKRERESGLDVLGEIGGDTLLQQRDGGENARGI